MDLKFLGGLNEEESVKQKRTRLIEKWEKATGLVKDLPGEKKQGDIAQLFENEAKFMLRLLQEGSTEASALKGFQTVAFPLVRRVFGGLVANELVSVQPMSLPSGLLFYLDYQFGTGKKAGGQKLDWTSGGSVFGDQEGVGVANLATGGHYNLASSYSKLEVTGTVHVKTSGAATWANINYDPDLSASVSNGTLFFADFDLGLASNAGFTTANIDGKDFKSFSMSGTVAQTALTASGWANVKAVYRRHNTFNTSSNILRLHYSASAMLASGGADYADMFVSVVKKATNTVDESGLVHNPVFESTLNPDPVIDNVIPEVDIKIQSVSVTAQTRKLKTKWTPELAQDMNAYQGIDPEVELTKVLSDQIAIDIDNEILTQLYNEASAATFYWSREPGQFVNKNTGVIITGPSFTGDVAAWYQTLLQTIHDAANVIQKKTLRSSANFLVVSPEVATILEGLQAYKPALSLDGKDTLFTLGIEKMGTLNNRYTVYKSAYVYSNQILVGYKGSSFLETGFVYAPYVPLVVTPTIFAPEDFTPRKAVMTRYGKQMVRSDFYAKVIVRDMNVL